MGMPKGFEGYRDVLEQSKKKYIRINFHKDDNANVTASKLLGRPYFPKGAKYPEDKTGAPLVLLMQLNLQELPHYDLLPDAGILQFYIQKGMNDEHVWGMNTYDKKPWDSEEYFQLLREQSYFRVIYHSEFVNSGVAVESEYPVYSESYELPVTEEAALSFSVDEEYVNLEDYKFMKFFQLTSFEFYEKYSDVGWEKLNQFAEYLRSSAPAKIGGYGRFVQDDPRHAAPKNEDWLVLLNIDSMPFEGGGEILWGDSGVATFFVRKEDLLNRDFSNVAYYWDNH